MTARGPRTAVAVLVGGLVGVLGVVLPASGAASFVPAALRFFADASAATLLLVSLIVARSAKRDTEMSFSLRAWGTAAGTVVVLSAAASLLLTFLASSATPEDPGEAVAFVLSREEALAGLIAAVVAAILAVAIQLGRTPTAAWTALLGAVIVVAAVGGAMVPSSVDAVELVVSARLALFIVLVVLFLVTQRATDRHHRASRAVVLGVVAAVAAVLGAGAALVELLPRASDAEGTAAEILTGNALPPEWTPERWLTAWRPEPLWIALAALSLALLVRATVTSGRRASERAAVITMPVTIAVTVTIATSLWGTIGPLAVYRTTMVSAVLIGTGVLLLAGTVAGLALPAPRRSRARWYPLGAVMSWAAVGVVLTSHELLRWTAATVWGAILVPLLAALAGAVLGGAVRSAAGRGRWSVVGAIAVAAGCVVITTVRLTGDALLAPRWFGAMGRTTGASPLEDQRAGALVFAVAAGLALVAAVVVLVASARTAPAEPTVRRPDERRVRALEEYRRALAGSAAVDHSSDEISISAESSSRIVTDPEISNGT